ncbi:hypothetical protein AK812_SmicGene26674 [Symbiodinium microadriaticum]|uniref:Uncharacterized protein n=1 Tax=Symbiodinium microadriaticum TaxID=2951 RepID=A0A1Q9D8T4_SYMMI|nr:hypothetical protein AK812_SmicGene26674 [Symbiodinium microadriaticum]
MEAAVPLDAFECAKIHRSSGVDKNARFELHDLPTLHELEQTILRLPRNKAGGPSKVVGEHWLADVPLAARKWYPVLLKCHVRLCEPIRFATSLLCCLYKGRGPPAKLANQRSIYLFEPIGKCCRKLLRPSIVQQVMRTSPLLFQGCKPGSNSTALTHYALTWLKVCKAKGCSAGLLFVQRPTGMRGDALAVWLSEHQVKGPVRLQGPLRPEPWAAAGFTPEDNSLAAVITNPNLIRSRVEVEVQEAAGCLELLVEVPPKGICSVLVPKVSLFAGPFVVSVILVCEAAKRRRRTDELVQHGQGSSKREGSGGGMQAAVMSFLFPEHVTQDALWIPEFRRWSLKRPIFRLIETPVYPALFMEVDFIQQKVEDAESKGIFPKDATLKDFLRSKPACLVTLRMLWQFARDHSATDCRSFLEDYVVGGKDEGLTESCVRQASGLKVIEQTEDPHALQLRTHAVENEQETSDLAKNAAAQAANLALQKQSEEIVSWMIKVGKVVTLDHHANMTFPELYDCEVDDLKRAAKHGFFPADIAILAMLARSGQGALFCVHVHLSLGPYCFAAKAITVERLEIFYEGKIFNMTVDAFQDMLSECCEAFSTVFFCVESTKPTMTSSEEQLLDLVAGIPSPQGDLCGGAEDTEADVDVGDQLRDLLQREVQDLLKALKTAKGECEIKNEFEYLSIDATVKCMMKILGQARFNQSQENRDAAAIDDMNSVYKLLTVRGRSNAVLALRGIKSEASALVADALSSSFSSSQRLQVSHIASDDCPSPEMLANLKTVCPNLRSLPLDAMHIVMVYDMPEVEATSGLDGLDPDVMKLDL